MATVTFRAKPYVTQAIERNGEAIAIVDCQCVKIPKLASRHCDMHAFRTSREFGEYANSDLFPAVLRRRMNELGVPERYLRLDSLPECVSVDTSGFLAVVTITV